MPSPHILALIEKAKAAEAARRAAQSGNNTLATTPPTPVSEASQGDATPHPKYPNPATIAVASNTTTNTLNFNTEQQQAIVYGIEGKSFCLTGAAGTGKTTVTQELISQLQQQPHVSPLSKSTKWLNADAPGIVICGYTNKAVNNIRKRLPRAMKSHCITIHKLIEYTPTLVEKLNEDGELYDTKEFRPTYKETNKLPHISTIIFEESSMIGTDLYGEVLAALPMPERTQMIFLGDLNQLKPVFGHSIFGFKMSELPVIELTRVYRQALMSPIIGLASAIRTNSTGNSFVKDWQGDIHLGGDKTMTLPKNLTEKTVIASNSGQGTVIIQPWKKRLPHESVMPALVTLWQKMMKEGEYDPDKDMILCPFNKSFGTIEINRQIANYLGKKRNAEVFEVIARGQRHYYAVGDRVLADKREGVITKITRNYGYIGKSPRPASTTLDRWGRDTDPNNQAIGDALNMPVGSTSSDASDDIAQAADDILSQLEALAMEDEDSGTNKASHIITVEFPSEDEDSPMPTTETYQTAGEINNLLFAYALTVHKSQGSEWQRVIVMLHGSHATMLSRELLYTAVTRAKQELIIFCEGDGKFPNQIWAAADRPDIPGTTLAHKIAYFTEKGKAQKF